MNKKDREIMRTAKITGIRAEMRLIGATAAIVILKNTTGEEPDWSRIADVISGYEPVDSADLKGIDWQLVKADG
jgi:hypothetical protein